MLPVPLAAAAGPGWVYRFTGGLVPSLASKRIPCRTR
jgi:hypothetical protein